jgi:hypothetical protein
LGPQKGVAGKTVGFSAVEIRKSRTRLLPDLAKLSEILLDNMPTHPDNPRGYAPFFETTELGVGRREVRLTGGRLVVGVFACGTPLGLVVPEEGESTSCTMPIKTSTMVSMTSATVKPFSVF